LGSGENTEREREHRERERENYLGVYVVQRPLKRKLPYLCTSNAERRQNSKLMIESLIYKNTICGNIQKKIVLKTMALHLWILSSQTSNCIPFSR
jgi:hypothetical protein